MSIPHHSGTGSAGGGDVHLPYVEDLSILISNLEISNEGGRETSDVVGGAGSLGGGPPCPPPPPGGPPGR